MSREDVKISKRIFTQLRDLAKKHKDRSEEADTLRTIGEAHWQAMTPGERNQLRLWLTAQESKTKESVT